MAELTMRRVPLSTGVELDVLVGGNPAKNRDPIILLHGFPESHRTWRHQAADLAKDHLVIVPDQRGYAGSSKPPAVEDYATDKIVADVFALADALGVGEFTLAGHDWGGAAAWATALRDAPRGRIPRLIIANAPHPYIFQRSLFDHPAQRKASQYIRAFRNPNLEAHIEKVGLEQFFQTTFVGHADPATMAEEKPHYLQDWSSPGALTAMLNWYRAASIVVPDVDEEAPSRPAFLDQPFPKLRIPTLVIWGMADTALLPVQLEGLGDLVEDLHVVPVPAGHFVTWEDPAEVIRIMRVFLDREEGHRVGPLPPGAPAEGQ